MYSRSTISELIQPLRMIEANDILRAHGGDANAKGFRIWDQLVAMIVCQLDGHESLRSLIEGYNGQSGQHYHLGSRAVSRSSLAYANAHRDVAAFGAVFSRLAGLCSRAAGKQAAQAREIVHLIDSSPIPLKETLFKELAVSNGRIKGMKLHMIHDATHALPVYYQLSLANVNDIEAAMAMPLQECGTYVFDKGYCSIAFWSRLHPGQARQWRPHHPHRQRLPHCRRNAGRLL
jgi:putative transposase